MSHSSSSAVAHVAVLVVLLAAGDAGPSPARAETREASARLFQSLAATKIKIKEADIAALEAMIDQAKVEHDDSLKQELETKRNIAEIEKQLLKERERLRHRDINFAKAEIAYHEAEVETFTLERNLARMRGRRTSVEGDIPSQQLLEAAWQLDRQIRELEGETLDAQVDAASRQKKLAEAAVEITKARRNVWEAQQQLINRTSQPG